MRQSLAKSVVMIGVGLAAMGVQGCRKQAAPAPVQPVVRSVPNVQPDFPSGSLPVENVDPVAAPRMNTAARRQQQQQQVQPVRVQNGDIQNAAIAAAQRVQDARLLQQQLAASQRQQQELNQEIQQDVKAQQDVQAEPRIQDVPGAPIPVPIQPTQPQ